MNKKNALVAGGIAVAVAIVCCGAGVIFSSRSDPRTEVTSTPPSVAASPNRTVTAVGINEGDYRVPDDIKPGTYKAKVPAGSFGCYWERDSSDDNKTEHILANGNAGPGASVTVVIKPTDKFFRTNGCGVFMKVK
jgi:hypothetical protein